MRVAILSAGSSVHTIRWVRGLAKAGLDVHLITQHPLLEPLDDVAEVHQFPFRKLFGYFTMVPGVRKLLRRIRPEVVNAHYASGYGTTARLVGYRPWILSVWGCDVYDAPFQSFLHKRWIKANLEGADSIISTSQCMAEQTRRVSSDLGEISVVPFGVNLEAYEGIEKQVAPENAPLVVGTVKSMEPVYGIDILIRSFALAFEQLTHQDSSWSSRLTLRLIGGGSAMEEYRQLSQELGIGHVTEFVGQLPHSEIPCELIKFDVFAALSRSESFGVAVVEAGAAGLPVLVSDAEGLKEIVVEGRTGRIVPREDVTASAAALIELLRNRDLRQKLGQQGRQHAFENYNWSDCVQKMIQAYVRILSTGPS
jgi:L-malate glycosyltransferase